MLGQAQIRISRIHLSPPLTLYTCTNLSMFHHAALAFSPSDFPSVGRPLPSLPPLLLDPLRRVVCTRDSARPARVGYPSRLAPVQRSGPREAPYPPYAPPPNTRQSPHVIQPMPVQIGLLTGETGRRSLGNLASLDRPHGLAAIHCNCSSFSRAEKIFHLSLVWSRAGQP